jgi:hypothetical protein
VVGGRNERSGGKMSSKKMSSEKLSSEKLSSDNRCGSSRQRGATTTAVSVSGNHHCVGLREAVSASGNHHDSGLGVGTRNSCRCRQLRP